MNCHACEGVAKKNGQRNGRQRYYCRVCRTYFSEPRDNPLGEMRLSLDKAVLVLNLLLEGCTVRSASRISGVHKTTILKLIRQVGGHCERLLEDRIRDLPVKDVEADELWQFVACKSATKRRKGLSDPHVGDSYTFIALESNTKLVLCWHLGHRDYGDTSRFIGKLHRATTGSFQLSTDGWAAYPDAV